MIPQETVPAFMPRSTEARLDESRDVIERMLAAHDAGDDVEMRVACAYARALLVELRRHPTPKSPAEAAASRMT